MYSQKKSMGKWIQNFDFREMVFRENDHSEKNVFRKCYHADNLGARTCFVYTYSTEAFGNNALIYFMKMNN